MLTAYVMKTLDEYFYQAEASTNKDPVTYLRIAEAFKHAYGQRTKLGDPKFVPEVREVRKKVPRIGQCLNNCFFLFFSFSSGAKP